MRTLNALEALIEEAVEKADYDHALSFYESHERAAVLIGWGDRLSDDELRDLLSAWWTSIEAWSGDRYLREGMIGLLRRVAPLHVVSDEEPDRHELSGLLTVYRGNLGEDPRLGHSWTLDRAVAEQFALMANSPRGAFLGMYREDGVPSVWKARVAADDVLGYFDDRNEAEVVVDPATLRDVELLGIVEAPGEAGNSS